MPAMSHTYTDETDQLLAYVAQQRNAIRLTAYELTTSQANLTPTKSSLSIGGIIKHLALCEQSWVERAHGRERPQRADYFAQFSLAEDETLKGILALYDEVAAETERSVRELGLAHPVRNPKGAPWFPADVDAWDVRWLLLHLIEETARHAGHADIIREHIDGRQMGDIMAEVENWVMPDWAK